MFVLVAKIGLRNSQNKATKKEIHKKNFFKGTKEDISSNPAVTLSGTRRKQQMLAPKQDLNGSKEI